MSDPGAAGHSTADRIAALALVAAPRGDFAAVAFRGDSVTTRLTGRAAIDSDARQLAGLVEALPVVTDDPPLVDHLLNQVGAPKQALWNVVELAALLVPACPRDSL